MIPQRSMRFGLRVRAAIGHETAALGAPRRTLAAFGYSMPTLRRALARSRD